LRLNNCGLTVTRLNLLKGGGGGGGGGNILVKYPPKFSVV